MFLKKEPNPNPRQIGSPLLPLANSTSPVHSSNRDKLAFAAKDQFNNIEKNDQPQMDERLNTEEDQTSRNHSVSKGFSSNKKPLIP